MEKVRCASVRQGNKSPIKSCSNRMRYGPSLYQEQFALLLSLQVYHTNNDSVSQKNTLFCLWTGPRSVSMLLVWRLLLLSSCVYFIMVMRMNRIPTGKTKYLKTHIHAVMVMCSTASSSLCKQTKLGLNNGFQLREREELFLGERERESC